MRISDWSSDVCSADLKSWVAIYSGLIMAKTARLALIGEPGRLTSLPTKVSNGQLRSASLEATGSRYRVVSPLVERSEERRVGKEGVRKCRSRVSEDQ